jgi:hypothetical protein
LSQKKKKKNTLKTLAVLRLLKIIFLNTFLGRGLFCDVAAMIIMFAVH